MRRPRRSTVRPTAWACALAACALPAGLRAQAPPAAPEGLEAEYDDGRVELEWEAGDASNRYDAVLFRVYRDGARIGVSYDEDHEDVDVETGRAYTYRVAGVDLLGREGERSSPATVSIPGGDPPDAPRNLLAEATSDSRIELRWDAPAGDVPVARYRVYRDEGTQPVASSGASSYEDSGLQSYAEYTYRVSAVSEGEVEGPRSDAVTARTLDGTPPNPPGEFTAEATGPERVELTWTPANDPESGVAYYRVFRDGEALGTSPGAGFVDLTVSPETTYAYDVAAVNGADAEGARAGALEVVTPPRADTVPPAPPTGLRVAGPAAGL